MRKELLARISDKNLRGIVEKAFDVAERFAARRQVIDNDTRFSDIGRLDALAAELDRDFAPAFRLARQPLRDAREAIEARRAKVALPAIDPADVVAQMQRMERRAAVAALPEAERSKVLFDDATDRRIIDAVLTEAPEVSGVARIRHTELLSRRLRELHGSEMAVLERDEKDLAEAEAAVAVARNNMRASFDPKSNDTRFDRIMTQGLVPWLVDRGGSISVVKIDANGNATYPEATELEKRTGKFFRNIAEYKAQAQAP